MSKSSRCRGLAIIQAPLPLPVKHLDSQNLAEFEKSSAPVDAFSTSKQTAASRLSRGSSKNPLEAIPIVAVDFTTRWEKTRRQKAWLQKSPPPPTQRLPQQRKTGLSLQSSAHPSRHPPCNCRCLHRSYKVLTPSIYVSMRLLQAAYAASTRSLPELR